MTTVAFEKQPDQDPNDPFVVVKAAQQTAHVQQLLTYINQFDLTTPTLIPIKKDGGFIMIKVSDLILADIVAHRLVLTTTDTTIQSHDTLNHLLTRLKSPNMIQVSKHAIINVNHLLSLSDSFSGTMTAHLTNGHQTTVSRSFVRPLLHQLEG